MRRCVMLCDEYNAAIKTIIMTWMLRSDVKIYSWNDTISGFVWKMITAQKTNCGYGVGVNWVEWESYLFTCIIIFLIGLNNTFSCKSTTSLWHHIVLKWPNLILVKICTWRMWQRQSLVQIPWIEVSYGLRSLISHLVKIHANVLNVNKD